MPDNNVVVIVPVGRKETLSILIPHLLKAREDYRWCEFWMNATWSKEDEAYIHGMVKQYPRDFLLKDDGDWCVKKEFINYSRYYPTLPKDDTIYIKMDDDIVWMSRGAIRDLAEARRGNKNALMVVGNTVNNTFCNTKHQELGAYSPSFQLTANATDAMGHYRGDFAEYAHQTFNWHLKLGTVETAYKFEDCVRPTGIRTPNHVYAAYGKDITWSTDDEMIPTAGLATERNPIAVAGWPLFCHYAYTPQKSYLDGTNVLNLYKEAI